MSPLYVHVCALRRAHERASHDCTEVISGMLCSLVQSEACIRPWDLIVDRLWSCSQLDQCCILARTPAVVTVSFLFMCKEIT